ncbi:DUF417 family protein [Butyricimonas sp. Marseille-P3923]|uniref:DUF417 family protein n=1 Tax=Butyricimonas sp. Marseille-P3923 TaxID=1987504 RepID=UPI000C0861D5|nr:DUF417 family protein [Butyricimonas sp. Marseille-P3923]
MAKLSSLFVTFSRVAASSQKLGINLIRVAILVIFVWIGGLKFWNYEAEGIVPFVANSPFMSFFYTKSAPEYKDYKLKEGEYKFLVTTPEVWVPDWGSGEHGFPLLTGAGRLVIKDTAILAGALVVLSDSAKRVLNQLK